jgi:hypothetical protein
MSKRRHFKQTVPFPERLAQWAKMIREEAARLPPGRERDHLLMRASQADTASDIHEWANSPGLQPLVSPPSTAIK